MPQIMIVIKISKHRITWTIHIARFCRAQIPGLQLLGVEISCNKSESQEQDQEEEEKAEAQTAAGPGVRVAVSNNLENFLEEILCEIESGVGGAQEENWCGETINLPLGVDDLDKHEQYHGGIEEKEQDHHE